MGGVTNTLGYITAAFAMGMLLKGTDWISWRIDERRQANQEEEKLIAMALMERKRLHHGAAGAEAE
ncbi:hypothetical protein COCSUDRAFT_53185 [Coccomyxa subellipsoidea C-169]|uniref:Uncharacterized protein n=1 Tax=Coccomyxa subellipsoidea (strain C-169) TaxID=574566 RepID=I0Z034_COCSC|nr:hypothetical protein COCSUDRAFT_53185 [Coccomyxa subellipsoidea C-169]EIE24003.1 hypothetical protein COCSUDRAFT_53185 [Coccomyxa subellipsoidea C-169]|eukprot:XP_005648547.1 hypothetical protein COCSUDRAFT_53185 [Coccomyxa subellipsoidea C-169]